MESTALPAILNPLLQANPAILNVFVFCYCNPLALLVDVHPPRRGSLLPGLLEAMYRFGRDPACFQAWLQPLRPDQALAALWLAGRLQMPALQQAAAARLHTLHPGEASTIRIVDSE